MYKESMYLSYNKMPIESNLMRIQKSAIEKFS